MNVRLRRFMCHTCDLYKPASISRAVTGLPEAADMDTPSTPTYMGVVCHFESTSGYANPSVIGQSNENSVMTSDRWHFLSGQAVDTDWRIVMKTTGHPNMNDCWVVLGNPLVNASAPGRPADSKWVFAGNAPRIETTG